MNEDLRREIVLPAEVSVRLEGKVLQVRGPQGEVSRVFEHPKINLALEGKKVVFTVQKATKREKTILGSWLAHARNMVQGVQEPHIYHLKICSGHFPMNVSVAGQEFTIKNFLGETVPRKMTLPRGVQVKISGSDIVVSSPDKDAAGLAAAKIESLCRITDRDLRIFQDGCYITRKAGRDAQ